MSDQVTTLRIAVKAARKAGFKYFWSAHALRRMPITLMAWGEGGELELAEWIFDEKRQELFNERRQLRIPISRPRARLQKYQALP